ncbi:MAG: hypothetical protein ACI4P8_06265 [Akkermansia sp.]
MGFSAKTPSVPTPATTEIPVVTENLSEDSRSSYAQSNKRKRGLLSTILSARRQTAQNADAYNTTLG